MNRRDAAWLAATLLCGIGAALLAAYGTWGVPGEWQWQKRALASARWWMPLLPCLLIIGLSAWLLARAQRGAHISGWWALAFVLLAFALQVSTLAVAPESTFFAGAVILSPVATTYFTEATQVRDMRAFLRDYANRMRTFSQHAQTYPPGPIVFFWLRQRICERSAAARAVGATLIAMASGASAGELAAAYARGYGKPVTVAQAIAAITSAWLLGFIGCLSIVPMFFLARARWGNAAAVCAAALCAAVPSMILFTPSVLQLVTLETALTLQLFHLAWSRRSAAWGVAGGALWALAALTSLATLALVPLLAAWGALEHLYASRQKDRFPWVVIVSWLCGAAGLLGAAYLTLGVNFPAIMTSALGAHRDVTARAFARTYWRWLGWNLFDFWMFLGAGLGLWLLRQMCVEARALARRESDGLTPLLWAVAATVVALDVTGVVRAEVGRIWMFLMIPAAAAAGRHVSAAADPAGALGVILAAQLLQTIAFQMHLALFVVL